MGGNENNIHFNVDFDKHDGIYQFSAIISNKLNNNNLNRLFSNSMEDIMQQHDNNCLQEIQNPNRKGDFWQ